MAGWVPWEADFEINMCAEILLEVCFDISICGKEEKEVGLNRGN